jgi:O-6-methylguanine DNA methyltransferase
VWQELRRIPAGTTICYSELARRLGDPLAVRAVAAANARNPIAIVIPCHRVIAKSGALWGYGGGLWRKLWLLHHEGVRDLDESLAAEEAEDRTCGPTRSSSSP